ncbi:hypothetical protein HanLR1_Chr17g0656231 [Helianthus annuus]|nr:hypothetical protein HanHA89_Chr17g0697631 [Helianthus annuus]KAJ0631641.1 hypothetical protein HanLR1_Chr17g0656231 [Helianthus annuus]
MDSGSNAYKKCLVIQSFLEGAYNFLSPTPAFNHSHPSINWSDIDFQSKICDLVYQYEIKESKFGKPMLWIGIYIAVASLFCVLAMAADLFHGFRNKKLWFPSKYFTLNAASIMVITIAMKLPVDLNDPMPLWLDELAKLTSMPFMTTMMANLMPSLASMDGKELFENVIVPVSKQILENKYQAAHKLVSKDMRTRMSTVEELIQCVRRYSIMAGTSSPQFVVATTPLCSAAGIICIFSTIMYFYEVLTDINQGISYHKILGENNYYKLFLEYDSDYKWSMVGIFLIQSVGIVVGTIHSIFRCFAPLSFKLSLKWCKKHTKIFKVEKYWFQKLFEWKEIDLVLPIGSRTLKALVHNLNHFIIHVCTGFHMVIVVSCKTIALIPIGIVIIGVYCVHCWMLLMAMFFAMPMVSNRDIIHDLGPNDTEEDIENYVLRLENEMELGKRTLKSISKSVDSLIQKAEKKLPKNLLKLVERSTGFEGVWSFDSDEVQPLLSVKFPSSWSLPIVTLTCVARTLPNICTDTVDSLFNSVCEGLFYTFLVDESLNNDGEAKNIHIATRILWHEVEVTHKWLGNPLQRIDFREKSPREILKWYSDKAEEVINKSDTDDTLENSQNKLIAANSMYRITQTIMRKYPGSEHISEEQLFALLSDMIGSIVVACLTNLPRVIAMKCHGSTIEEREASVRAAAKILGSTKMIIERLQARELPSLAPDQMACIDEWRAYLKQSIP